MTDTQKAQWEKGGKHPDFDKDGKIGRAILENAMDWHERHGELPAGRFFDLQLQFEFFLLTVEAAGYKIVKDDK